jgi:hypothetical protein
MLLKDGLEMRVHRELLHLSSGPEDSGVNVEVVQLTMEDGVEIVGLEKEAFDAAFGGKENLHNEMARETAAYIEVIDLTSADLLDFEPQQINLANSFEIERDSLSAPVWFCNLLAEQDCRICAYPYHLE